jgi:aminopeptidase N
MGRFGGLTFSEDSLGNPWIYTACQGTGASLWWPNKDQQFDEPDSMTISVTVPSEIMNVSNGQFVGLTNHADGTTRYDWQVNYPINNYCVALNIGNYVHFSEPYKDSEINYYVLPYHLEPARQQFKQTAPMLECFEEYVGDYPFPVDGLKMVEVPYSGMEHQSAIAYGNRFKNGYLERDWTGVGISTRFDFIIIHEWAHEWFGNSVSCGDFSDAWIHEGWGTYLEAIYVECLWGYDAALIYLNGYKNKINNTTPIIGPTAVNHWPTGDMYFKGALFINTLRSIINDNEMWWSFVRDLYSEFSYQNIFTVDVLNFINNYFNTDFKPIFDQYLYHANIPLLQIRKNGESVLYRWKSDIETFNMPVLAGPKNQPEFIYPTNVWQQKMLSPESLEIWEIDTTKFYINVEVLDT